jgi:hypothetical protein
MLTMDNSGDRGVEAELPGIEDVTLIGGAV